MYPQQLHGSSSRKKCSLFHNSLDRIHSSIKLRAVEADTLSIDQSFQILFLLEDLDLICC